MKYYLTADTKEEILADLRGAGFEWYDTDEVGNPTGTRDPRRLEVAYKRGFGSCIYLEHLVEVPAVIDEEGNVVTPAVMTTTFHANVHSVVEHDFATAMQAPPTQPQYDWA